MLTFKLSDGTLLSLSDDKVSAVLHKTEAQAPEHSVDLTKNAKGDMQWTITVRGSDLSELATKAFEANLKFEAEYPRRV